MLVKKDVVVVMLLKKKAVVVMIVTNPSIGRSRIAVEDNQHLKNINFNRHLENVLRNQHLNNVFIFSFFEKNKLIHHWYYLLDIKQKQHISTLINQKLDTSI